MRGLLVPSSMKKEDKKKKRKKRKKGKVRIRVLERVREKPKLAPNDSLESDFSKGPSQNFSLD